MVAKQMGPRARHQSGESGDEVLGLEQHVSRALSERALQLEHHQGVSIAT